MKLCTCHEQASDAPASSGLCHQPSRACRQLRAAWPSRLNTSHSKAACCWTSAARGTTAQLTARTPPRLLLRNSSLPGCALQVTASVRTRRYPVSAPSSSASCECSWKLRRERGPVPEPSCHSRARKPPALPAQLQHPCCGSLASWRQSGKAVWCKHLHLLLR